MTSIKPLPQTPTTAPGLAAVQAASARTGIDFDYLVDVARVESRFDPTAKAPTSSARGLYQFTTQTWLATSTATAPAMGSVGPRMRSGAMAAAGCRSPTRQIGRAHV